MDIEYLKRRGYCITSRSARYASRIDREDWKTVCSDADYYRRCFSKDVIIVPVNAIKKLKNSHHGYAEFRK